MKNKIQILRFLIAIIIISFSVTAGDCDKILESGNVPSQILGNWKLVEQTGALQDICTDETVNFQSSGVAQLTCPNSTTISRNFSVQNDVLTYTETSVSYDVQFSNSNDSLQLLGRNISRNLIYQKIISDSSPVKQVGSTSANNSSEGGK